MAHLNLVMIHPFCGNGRVARCFQSLVLARQGVLSPVFMRWAIHFIATPAHGDPPPEANGAGQGLEHSRGGSQMDSPLLLTRQGICCFNTPPTPALTADLGLSEPDELTGGGCVTQRVLAPQQQTAH